MNEPLTLEQLREMDGKAVWVENKSNPYLNDWGIMLENICSAYYGIFDVEEYGKTWLAYAYPLAHIDREAWKSCKACTGCASCRHSLASGSDSKSACFWCDNHNKYRPRSFCPECGRPLTEEAWEELEKRVRGEK